MHFFLIGRKNFFRSATDAPQPLPQPPCSQPHPPTRPSVWPAWLCVFRLLMREDLNGLLALRVCRREAAWGGGIRWGGCRPGDGVSGGKRCSSSSKGTRSRRVTHKATKASLCATGQQCSKAKQPCCRIWMPRSQTLSLSPFLSHSPTPPLAPTLSQTGSDAAICNDCKAGTYRRKHESFI